MENIQIVRRICGILDGLRPVADNPKIKDDSVAKYEDLITYVKDRPGHDRRYAINSDRMQNELGWEPAETFESGIEKTVKWYLDNQEWSRDITDGNYARERLGNS